MAGPCKLDRLVEAYQHTLDTGTLEEITNHMEVLDSLGIKRVLYPDTQGRTYEQLESADLDITAQYAKTAPTGYNKPQ